MSEPLTDERLEELFDELRADTIAQVLPPGTEAARATVRRRRTATSVAAGIAVLAVAGVAAGLGAPTARLDTAGPAPTPSEDSSMGPALSKAALDRYSELAARAAKAVGGVSGDDSLGHVSPGIRATGFHGVVRGSYELLMSCVGTGAVTVTVKVGTLFQDEDGVLDGDRWTSGPLVRTSTVPCEKPTWTDEEQAVNELATYVKALTFTADQDATMVVRVDPDSVAAGRAAFAYQARLSQPAAEQLHDSARSALPSSAERSSEFLGSGFASAGMEHEAKDIAAGSYRLRVSCVGAGSMIAVVHAATGSGPAKEVARRKAPCGANPRITDVPFSLPRHEGMRVRVLPDDEALGQAGYAVGLYQD